MTWFEGYLLTLWLIWLKIYMNLIGRTFYQIGCRLGPDLWMTPTSLQFYLVETDSIDNCTGKAFLQMHTHTAYTHLTLLIHTQFSLIIRLCYRPCISSPVFTYQVNECVWVKRCEIIMAHHHFTCCILLSTLWALRLQLSHPWLPQLVLYSEKVSVKALLS